MQPHAIGLFISSVGSAIGGPAPGPVNLVTNGTFDDASGWTMPGDCSISGGVLTKVAGAFTRQVTQTPSPALVQGALYKTRYDVTARAAGTPRIIVGGAPGTARSAVGTYTEYIAAGTGATVALSFTSATDASVDNVSVYAATVTGVGSETLQDPGFDTGIGWALTGSASISGGSLTLSDSTGSATATHSPAIVVGGAYRIAYTVTKTGSGTFMPGFGGTTLDARTGSGTYSQDVVAQSTSGLNFLGVNGETITVDDASVKPLTLSP